MEEILKISDDVTIMRDGKRVGTWPAGELTEDLIIRRMVGRDLIHRFPERSNVPGEVALRVVGLTSPLPRSFKDVTFDLRRGEILGVGGLVGAQRTELIEALFGMRSVERGQVFVHGRPEAIHSPQDAKRLGMALLTEDRRGSGIFPALSVLENSLIANLRRYLRAGLLDDGRRRADAARMVQRLRVKTPSLRTPMRDLSGGNQQKVLFGRWLLTEPEILLLDEPTRGIDVGAKYEIYTIIAELAQQGKSIVMISSEMPELLGMSDRILVMCEGRVSGILEGNHASQEEIMRLAAQFM
jgi:methyl-galactoside transport system ATP-binding protein